MRLAEFVGGPRHGETMEFTGAVVVNVQHVGLRRVFARHVYRLFERGSEHLYVWTGDKSIDYAGDSKQPPKPLTRRRR